MPHSPYVSQQGYEPPSTQDGLTTQLGDHTATSPSADTPAYTSFLHGLLTQIRDGTDSESDGSLVPDGQSFDDAEPEPGPISTLDDLQPMHSGHVLRSDGEASACGDACDNGSDLHNEADSCADTSDDGNPLIDYPTCANYNCNRPSNRPDVPGALCCSRCQPIPHSMHTTSCNRAWIEEMLLDLEHTAARSRAEPVIARTTVARSLAWTATIALSLALSPLPLSCNVLAVVLAHLTPLVHAAPARLPTPPAFDIDADSGQGSGGGTPSDSHRDHHGVHATPSATVTTNTTIAPQSTDDELPAVITLTDVLTAGSDGFLTPYDGAQIPCEMPDCPYVASIVAGDFMALCCYDCALYHAHSCSRTPFPLGASAPGDAASTNIAVPGDYDGGGDSVIAAAAEAGMTFGTLPDIQPPNPCGLLTAAQLAGMARQPGQSASNADVCDIAAAIAASLADLRTDTPVATPVSTAPLGVSSSATTAAPAIWDDFSGANVPGPASTHVESLRTLSSARAGQSDLATAHVASLTSLTHTDRSDALHLHRISSDAALLATSADVVVTLYGFIAQATDSLQHLQQQYDEQCTPDSAAALDVARIALTHGLAALHGVLPLSVLLPYGDRYGTPYFTRRDLLLDDLSAQHTLSQRTGSSRRTGPTPMLLLFALVASTIFIAQLSVSATVHTTQPSALAPHGSAASAPSGPTALSPHASAASAPAGPTVLPEGSGIPIQADETRAGVADLSVTARTTGIVRSDTLATNARTRGTGPVPSRRGDEHAMREALHQRRIPFRRSPAQADDDDDDEPVQPPDYVIAAAVSCVPGYRISGNARTMPSRGTRSPGPVTGANNAAAVGLVLFKRHDIDDTHSFWSEESTARMQLGLEVAGHFEFASPITAAKAQLLAMVMAVLWVRRFRSLPPGTTVAYITSNDSHVQMIRQGGMSESESLWNAIDFLQRAFQDQPELFGSRGMESLFGTGTALYDATKRLVPDSGNAITSTERGLEYAPLIAAALTECVFFDAGVPGPIRKAHELWTAARVEVCKNHVAGHQFEAQRSATAEAASDHTHGRARDDHDEGIRHSAPNVGGPSGASDGVGDAHGGDGTGGHGDRSDSADRRTRRRLANVPVLADDTAASLPGSLPSGSPIAPAPAPSAAMPVALAPARDQATAYADGGNTSVLTLSGARDGTDSNGASAVPLAKALAGTDGADASGMPALSGAGPGAQ